MRDDNNVNPELHESVKAELQRIGKEVKALAGEALEQAKKNGDMAASLKPHVDEMLIKQGELQARLLEVEQKQARPVYTQPEKPKSLGAQLVASEEFKAFASGGMRSQASSFVFKAAAITSEDNVANPTTTVGVPPDVRPGIVPGVTRDLRIRDLMLPGTTDGNLVQYVRETGFTNNAGPVSEANQKPESGITFDLVSQPVVTIAHYIKATKQLLDDMAALQSQVDGRLRYGVKYAEEQQLLNGSGSGNNLPGLYTSATAYSAPSGATVTSETRIDRLRLMILQVALAEYALANGIVLHPTDWANIELTKDSNNQYIFARPTVMAGPTLWGLPVVATKSMTQDRALVGAFTPFSQIFDRESVNVVIATQNEDDFTKNIITIRCEERLASAVYRSEAFVKASDLSP